MTLDNFEDHQLDKHLEKGMDYFRKKKVVSLEETEEGEWHAEVAGREVYEVVIEMDEDEIVSTYCDCRAFTDDTDCKHVIAVLYALQKKQGLSDPDLLDDIKDDLLQLLTPDQIRAFLAEELDDSRALLRSLDKFARQVLDKEPVESYSTALKQELAKYTDSKGTIPYGKIAPAIAKAQELLDKANELADEKNYPASLDILLALLQVLPQALTKTNDKDDAIFDVIDETFDILCDISLKSDVDAFTNQRIYRHAIELARNPLYPLDKYYPHWIDILTYTIDEHHYDDILEVFEEMIATAGAASETANVERLEMLKATYIELMAPPQKTLKVVKSPRLTIADRYPEYTAAKQAMIAKIEQALEEKDAAAYEACRQPLLDMMQQRSDIPGIREWAFRFYTETNDPKYLETIKDTYMKSEWEKVKKQYS